MPTSHPLQLDAVVGLVVTAKARSVLDVGTGFGKYGILAREYLDPANFAQQEARGVRIDGIEVFEPYVTPVHRFVYDHLYIGDAVPILRTLDSTYDLVLLVDVIEHLERAEGIELLRACARVGRNVLVSTPKDIGKQGAEFGNPAEVHRTQWGRGDFRAIGSCFFVSNPLSIICVLGRDAAEIRSRWQSRGRRLKGVVAQNRLRRIVNAIPFLRRPYQRFERPIERALKGSKP